MKGYFKELTIISCVFALLANIKCTTNNSDDIIKTHFLKDTSHMDLRQIVKQPDGEKFLCIYYRDPPMAFGSGHKILNLYSHDSILVDQAIYGELPLEIVTWRTNGSIWLAIEVFSVHGDSALRTTYLNQWANSNLLIGGHNIFYYKEYNYHQN